VARVWGLPVRDSPGDGTVACSQGARWATETEEKQIVFGSRAPGTCPADKVYLIKTKQEDNNMDLLDKIMAYEGGEWDEDSTIEFFQELIDNGMAWTLQGHYGRTAKELIEAGLCTVAERRAAK
jgi:hypothetical protein